MNTPHPLNTDNKSGVATITSPVIRTPDQRVRVFVSSTLDELAAERAAVREAITQLRLTPVLFESGARPYPPRELYRAYLAQSDIFVGLYLQRYGWVAPEMDISGLEDVERLSAGKPRLIYVKQPAPQREPRLQDLLDRIRTENVTTYQKFATPAELQELVANDLAQVLTDHFTHTHEPLTSPPGPFAPLPIPRSSLINRTHELAQAHDLLLREDVGLVTLTGPGGVGKTRLAIQIATDIAAHFESGVAFVSLGAARRCGPGGAHHCPRPACLGRAKPTPLGEPAGVSTHQSAVARAGQRGTGNRGGAATRAAARKKGIERQ